MTFSHDSKMHDLIFSLTLKGRRSSQIAFGFTRSETKRLPLWESAALIRRKTQVDPHSDIEDGHTHTSRQVLTRTSHRI